MRTDVRQRRSHPKTLRTKACIIKNCGIVHATSSILTAAFVVISYLESNFVSFSAFHEGLNVFLKTPESAEVGCTFFLILRIIQCVGVFINAEQKDTGIRNAAPEYPERLT